MHIYMHACNMHTCTRKHGSTLICCFLTKDVHTLQFQTIYFMRGALRLVLTLLSLNAASTGKVHFPVYVFDVCVGIYICILIDVYCYHSMRPPLGRYILQYTYSILCVYIYVYIHMYCYHSMLPPLER